MGKVRIKIVGNYRRMMVKSKTKIVEKPIIVNLPERIFPGDERLQLKLF